MSYTGPSIVDYLKSVGKPSSFGERAKLASQQGITGYTGTAEQNIRLLTTLRSQTPTPTQPTPTTPLTEPTTGPPTTTGGDFVIPEPTGDTPDVSNAKSRVEFFKEQQRIEMEKAAAAAKRVEEQEKAQAKAKESFLKNLPIAGKFLAGKEAPPSVAEKRAGEFEEIGVEPSEFFKEQAAATAEIGSLLEDYDKLVAKKDQGLVNIETRLQGRPGAILRGEQALFQKQANIELSQSAAQINTKMAIQEMKNGNFEQARNFVREAVSDWTFDLNLELQQFEQFEEQNATIIADLDEEYKTALSDAKSAKLAEIELVEKEMTDKANLMVDAAKEGIDLGWTPQYMADKTLAELTQEYSSRVATAEAAGITEFTPTQKLSLEQAGLANAPRQTQLDYLFGEGVGRRFEDDEIRANIRDDKRNIKAENPNISDDEIYQMIVDGITVSKDISNKSRAIMIAGEIFGKVVQPSTSTIQTPATTIPTKPGIAPGQFYVAPFDADIAESFWGQLGVR